MSSNLVYIGGIAAALYLWSRSKASASTGSGGPGGGNSGGASLTTEFDPVDDYKNVDRRRAEWGTIRAIVVGKTLPHGSDGGGAYPDGTHPKDIAAATRQNESAALARVNDREKALLRNALYQGEIIRYHDGVRWPLLNLLPEFQPSDSMNTVWIWGRNSPFPGDITETWLRIPLSSLYLDQGGYVATIR